MQKLKFLNGYFMLNKSKGGLSRKWSWETEFYKFGYTAYATMSTGRSSENNPGCRQPKCSI